MTSRPQPQVSILLATYNHAPYIEQALDSIAAQGFTDFEVVITDDCSDDDSAAVIRGWLDRHDIEASLLVNERNLGVCRVRSEGLARARGQLVCLLDGDDFFVPDRLERQVPFLMAQPDEVGAVYSDVSVCDAAGTVTSSSYLDRTLAGRGRPEGWIFTDVQRGCFLPNGAVLGRPWSRCAATWRVLPTSITHSRYMTPPYKSSEIRIHEQWLGRDPRTDERAAYWIRHAALVLSGSDRVAARRALTGVRHVPAYDGIPWGAVRTFLAVPGSGVSLNVALDVRRRVRAARR